MDKKIQSLYTNKYRTGSFSGQPSFQRVNKLKDDKSVVKALQSIDSYTKFRPARKIFPRRKTKVYGVNVQLQADLMFMIKHSAANRGVKYVLLVIDCFSRKLYSAFLKTKSGPEVAKAMDGILKKLKEKPSFIQFDEGKMTFSDCIIALIIA